MHNTPGDVPKIKVGAEGGENHVCSAVGGAKVGRGSAAGDRRSFGSVSGSRFARRVGGVGYLFLKRFRCRRMR